MSLSHDFGKAAEEIAATYFQEHGFAVLARNFRSRRGEIDLVVRRESLVIFLEVKGRSRDWEHSAWQPLWRGKRQRIRHAARCFLAREAAELGPDTEFRFDIVFVTQGRVVAHYRNEVL
jgi:putative endonuclease